MKKLVHRIQGRLRRTQRAWPEGGGRNRAAAVHHRPHDPELALTPPFALLVTGPR